jgi:hypothetical protein
MNILKKMLVLLLTVLLVNLLFFSTGFAQQNWYSKADITKHPPVIRSLPAEKIPVEVVKGGGGSTWLWALLGVAAIGGVVAAAGGGGSSGGGGGGDEPPPEADTGNVSVSW